MFILRADANRLTVRRREAVTSGSVGASGICFEFSPEWDGMTRTAVFKAGTVSRSVLLDGGNACVIPWEVLERPNVKLEAGVCGARGESVVFPTIWAGLGTVLEGATPGEEARPPTPDLWRQELDEELKRIPAPAEALTNLELEELLK